MPPGVRDLVLFGVLTAIYFAYSWFRHAQLRTAGYDLGIFDQTVRAYSRFRAPLVTLKGDDYNILGDHFHPILMALAPLYWLWDDPRVLLLAQAAVIAGSAVVVRRYASRRMIGALPWWIAIGYGLAWPTQALIDFDFHEVALAVPLLGLAVYALDRCRAGVRDAAPPNDVLLLVCCLGLVLTREDMGLLVLVLGFLRLLVPGRRWLGAVLMVLGPLIFVLVTKVVIPHFNAGGQFAYWEYDALGPDLPSALGHLITHPVQAGVTFVWPRAKLATLAWLLVPLLALPLRSPIALLAVPLLAQRFYSTRSLTWNPYFHYNAAPWIILVLAALDAVARFREPWGIRLKRALAGTMLVAALVPTLLANNQFAFYRLLYGKAYATTGLMIDQRALLARIPAGTCVDVDDRLAPQLTHSNSVSLPTKRAALPDLYAIDLSQESMGYQAPAPQAVLDWALSKGFVEVFRQRDLLLLRNPDYAGPTPRCTP